MAGILDAENISSCLWKLEIPLVKFYSPSCRPWSISSTRRDLEVTNKERRAEKPTIDFIKKDIVRRQREGCKFLLEQPWSSALWEHLKELSADIHRTDQCRFGAQDELENPILKPTGLQGDLPLRACVQRCKGHMGKRHGWLQGQTGGNNRTTLASVYPDQMCRAIAKDVKKYIQGDLLLHARMTGGDQRMYYTCLRSISPPAGGVNTFKGCAHQDPTYHFSKILMKSFIGDV